jgi:hypothetical protein
MIRSVIAAIKNSYKPLCKQESDNLWCRGKLLVLIKRAMNSSRIELLWLVWDQSRSKYYLRTKFPAQEFQMGEFPEILITKSRSRFYCTWFFSRAENFCWEEIVRENNVSSAGDPVHAGDKTLTRETPAQRGGLTGMTLSHVWYSGLSNHLIWKWQLPGSWKIIIWAVIFIKCIQTSKIKRFFRFLS